MFEKFRAFADMGRTQGITTTASIAIAGALTSTVQVEWYHILYFTIIACFSHTALNVYIALGDITLDIHTYVPSRNPVINGRLTKRDAMNFAYGGTIACVFLIFLLLFYLDYFTVLIAFLCFISSYAWLIWYGWKGKRFLFSYDFSFSFAYTFTVLFGVFAVGGLPTEYTWIFIGVVVFAATAFAQWENGLKDVKADGRAGVRSFAVITNVKENEKLNLGHPYFLYGLALKSAFIICCFLAFLESKSIYYLLFLLLYGVPSQSFIMYRFLKGKKPIDHRKTILLDVSFSGILCYSVIFGRVGIWPILFLVAYLIFGYLIGSSLQSKCEFKFRRFSRKIS